MAKEHDVSSDYNIDISVTFVVLRKIAILGNST
jgi:hypothetical protein